MVTIMTFSKEGEVLSSFYLWQIIIYPLSDQLPYISNNVIQKKI